ncbi:MAG: PilZ domain-containing protein [Elusimicrobia bacterium]|nr:PilZ domain-containing protein [Elusimicrobiota bacterium]
MSSKNGTGRHQERRRHPRFPVVDGMIEPITISFSERDKKLPAILTNLSAGGMSLILFLEPPRAPRLDMVLNLPGLEEVAIQGKVVRVNAKSQTYNVGIAFTKISRKHQDRINGMAEDHGDCETRITLRLPEPCVENCRFHWLCAKPQKTPHARWRAS